MSEANDYADALRKIIDACQKPFGKDARRAKQIATEVLTRWGRAVRSGRVDTPNSVVV